MVQTAATTYAMACAAVILFQLLLICGAPWGRLTQGGAHPGTLPRRSRIVAGLSAILLAGMALAILSAAGGWPDWPPVTGWLALAISTLSAIANIITPSRPERMLWGPVTLAMLALAGFVMLSV